MTQTSEASASTRGDRRSTGEEDTPAERSDLTGDLQRNTRRVCVLPKDRFTNSNESVTAIEASHPPFSLTRAISHRVVASGYHTSGTALRAGG